MRDPDVLPETGFGWIVIVLHCLGGLVLWFDGALSTGFSLDDDNALLTLKFTPLEI